MIPLRAILNGKLVMVTGIEGRREPNSHPLMIPFADDPEIEWTLTDVDGKTYLLTGGAWRTGPADEPEFVGTVDTPEPQKDKP